MPENFIHSSNSSSFVIAIDGPAASGKGTLCRRLASRLQLPMMDTGLLYRAVGVLVLKNGGNPDNHEDGIKAAQYMVDNIQTNDFLIDPALRGHGAGGAASKVSLIPKVRELLLQLQRNFANTSPGAILDGRDIGTIVCPDADVKLFVTASSEVRAMRRAMDRYGNKQDAEKHYEEILEKVKERDERDSNRAVAPLKPAEDGHIIDTSEITPDEVFDMAIDIIIKTIEKKS